MSDKQQLFDQFGTNSGYHGKGKYPLARLVTLCLANTMTIIDYALGRYEQGESSLLFSILNSLRKGDLLVADRHFAAAHFYTHYKSRGLEFITRAHQRLKMSRIRRIKSYGRGDFIGWLKINEIYRRKDADLPKAIMARFIKCVIRIRGQRKVVWIVTSLLDNNKYPGSEIVELYGRRWRIETLFRQLKVNVSADVLRSQTAAGVRKEIIARLVAVNVVRTIMLEAALENDVDPMRISFVHTVRAIISFSPALASQPIWKLPLIYTAMLIEIGTHLVPERPGRNEPREVRRECQHYPTLRTTRALWRKRNVA